MERGVLIQDLDIRSHLYKNLLEQFKVIDTRIVNEMGILWGSARVDIAVVNSCLHAYEIKSEADSLHRFERQHNAYIKVFDYLTLVVYENKVNELYRKYGHLLKCWGVYVVSGYRGNIKIDFKKASIKNNGTDVKSICTLLIREELVELLRVTNNGKGMRNLWSGNKDSLRNILVDRYEDVELISKVRECVKKRNNESWDYRC